MSTSEKKAAAMPLTIRPDSGTPYRLDPAQTLRAAMCLAKEVDRLSKATEVGKPRNLLADDGDEGEGGKQVPVLLVVTAKKHLWGKDQKLKPVKIAISHSLWNSPSSRICLITADPPSSNRKAYKDLVEHRLFPEDLKPRIARVIAYSKLKSKYKSYESRRQLVAEYDIFLADDRIISLLPNTLGKTFYRQTAKRPVPVSLIGREKDHGKGRKPEEGQLKRKRDKDSGGPETVGKPLDVGTDIQKALDCTVVHLAPNVTTQIKVAWAGWPVEWITENIEAAVEGLVTKHVPKGWRGVKSLHIKSPDSIALPIWLADELWTEDAEVLNQEAPFLEDDFNRPKKKRKNLDGTVDEKGLANTSKKRKLQTVETAEDVLQAQKMAKKNKKEHEESKTKLNESTMRKEDLEKQKKRAKRAAEKPGFNNPPTPVKEVVPVVVSEVASKKTAIDEQSKSKFDVEKWKWTELET